MASQAVKRMMPLNTDRVFRAVLNGIFTLQEISRLDRSHYRQSCLRHASHPLQYVFSPPHRAAFLERVDDREIVGPDHPDIAGVAGQRDVLAVAAAMMSKSILNARTSVPATLTMIIIRQGLTLPSHAS